MITMSYSSGSRRTESGVVAVLIIPLPEFVGLHSIAGLERRLAVDAADFVQPRVGRFVDCSFTAGRPGWNQEYRAVGLNNRAIDGAVRQVAAVDRNVRCTQHQ